MPRETPPEPPGQQLSNNNKRPAAPAAVIEAQEKVREFFLTLDPEYPYPQLSINAPLVDLLNPDFPFFKVKTKQNAAQWISNIIRVFHKASGIQRSDLLISDLKEIALLNRNEGEKVFLVKRLPEDQIRIGAQLKGYGQMHHTLVFSLLYQCGLISSKGRWLQ